MTFREDRDSGCAERSFEYGGTLSPCRNTVQEAYSKDSFALLNINQSANQRYSHPHLGRNRGFSCRRQMRSYHYRED